MPTASKRRKPNNRRACLVAIIGGSGAGKSYLAERLAEVLGPGVSRLTLDDFYHDRSHCSPARRARINFDHPRAIDWEEFEAVLSNLARGKPARIPRYDFSTHTRLSSKHLLAPGRVVLVEGLWPCHRGSIRGLFDLKIFLECSSSVRLRRRLKRDTAQRGRSRASVRSQFRATVAPMHDKFVVPQRRWADIVLTTPQTRPGIARLARKIAEIAWEKTAGNSHVAVKRGSF